MRISYSIFVLLWRFEDMSRVSEMPVYFYLKKAEDPSRRHSVSFDLRHNTLICQGDVNLTRVSPSHLQNKYRRLSRLSDVSNQYNSNGNTTKDCTSCLYQFLCFLLQILCLSWNKYILYFHRHFWIHKRERERTFINSG